MDVFIGLLFTGTDEKTLPETGTVAGSLIFKDIKYPSFQTIDIKCWRAFCQQFTALPCRRSIRKAMKAWFFPPDRSHDDVSGKRMK
jgi:hypothetical protein